MYDREAAVRYAHRWAFSRNPAFYDFEKIGGDCTNFASQVIYAGCGVMNYTPVFGWFYIDVNNRTPSWTGVNQLYNFLVSNTGAGPKGKLVDLYEVQPGDIIQLSFSENSNSFDHSPVVVDRGMGTPETILVAAHTVDSDMRPLATYPYNKYRAIKIFC